jgi:hypothetical protein
MRTTLSLDDDTVLLAKAYAESRALSLGKAVSDLVRRGLAAERPFRMVNGLCVFELPPDTPVVTTEHVRDLEDE